MKLNKGISLITLLAMIAIIVILASTITITGVNGINNTKKVAFATELVRLQSEIDIYLHRNDGNKPITNQTYASSSIPGNSSTLYEIDLNKLEITMLSNGVKRNNDTTDIYILDENNKVFYLKGKKIGNTTYYNLNEELRTVIDYNDVTKNTIN